ncbi:hypothetical protein BDW69DRAFT_163140 [Aspergillus filifer]
MNCIPANASPSRDSWSRYLHDLGDDITDPLTRLCLCLRNAEILDRMNCEGRTLLHLAAEHGNTSLVTELVGCGARLDIVDGKG